MMKRYETATVDAIAPLDLSICERSKTNSNATGWLVS